MKNNYLSFAGLSAICICLLALSVCISSCKKIDNPHNASDTKDTINYSILNTIIYIKFFDAASGEQIFPSIDNPIKVSFKGNSEAAIMDIIGNRKDSYSSTSGLMTFGLDPSAEFTPTNASPIKFTIVTTYDQHIPSYKDVTISHEGQYVIRVNLVNTSNPPQGIEIVQLDNVGETSNGIVQSTIEISTINSEASIVIPSGIRLMNSNNSGLSGKLNITMVYYSGEENGALRSLPGGATGTILAGTNENYGVFWPASYIYFEITDNFNQIATYTLNDSINITTNISNNIYNPVTGTNVNNEDDISVYNYDQDTGYWSKYNTAQILNNTINIKSNIISTYNFSWFIKNGCNNTLTFTASGDYGNCKTVPVHGILRKTVNDNYIGDIDVLTETSEFTALTYATGNTPVYIEWDNDNDACNPYIVDPAVNPVLLGNMCTSQPINIPVINQSGVSKTISGTIYGSCPSDTNIIIMPSFGLWIQPIDEQCWRWCNMKNGEFTICNVIYGETYNLGTYYNNEWYQWEITIDEDSNYNFELIFPAIVCLNVFGIL